MTVRFRTRLAYAATITAFSAVILTGAGLLADAAGQDSQPSASPVPPGQAPSGQAPSGQASSEQAPAEQAPAEPAPSQEAAPNQPPSQSPAEQAPATTAAAQPPNPEAALIDKGRYLAAAGDCVSCHTRPSGEPFAGGLPLKTPFGTIYSANITSDKETGIGGWSEEQLARAMREGIDDEGHHLYPAFPYTAYTNVTDDDIHAIYAYLKSLTPVSYTPPKNELSFPFNQRGLLAIWDALYLKKAPYKPDTAQSAEWNRGAYLVEGLGHCGACHTPRNQLGGERTSLALTGGVYQDDIADAVHEQEIVKEDNMVRAWSAVDLTPSPRGLGAWSVDDIAAYLKTGHNARAGAFGPMAEVVANSTKYLTDADTHAMAVYLKALKPAAQDISQTVTPDQMRQGEIAFTVRCGDCHLPTGLGSPRTPDADPTKVSPPLVGNAIVQAADPASLINVILYGAHETVLNDKSWPKMPGFELDFGLGMDDDQIAVLSDYVRNSWGNQGSAVDPKAVAKQR
jgi:mono/diheme cytochrome c family protein